MDHVVKILWTLAVYSASLQDMSVHGMVDFSSPWDTRVSSTLDFLQRDPCWGLSRGPKCNRSIFSNLNTRNIMLYTAETQRKLRVILPERKERRLTSDSKNNSYDAVFVLDPFPDANLGHTVFIFLLNFNVSRTVCNKSMNGLHVFTGKCRFFSNLGYALDYIYLLLRSIWDTIYAWPGVGIPAPISFRNYFYSKEFLIFLFLSPSVKYLVRLGEWVEWKTQKLIHLWNWTINWSGKWYCTSTCSDILKAA